MRKLVLAAFLISMIPVKAFASSAPADPAPAAVAPQPIPQNFTLGNNKNDADAPVTLILKDKDGKILTTLLPGSSTGQDPANCPCTLEVK